MVILRQKEGSDMLLEFSISNFMSFEEKNTLSMIPSIQSNRGTFNISGINVLKFATIYGGNASGKSNLIKALSTLTYILRLGLDERHRKLYCRVHEDNKDKPTIFSVTFYANEKFYNYYFEVLLAERKVIFESLSELNPKTGNGKEIYTYTKGELDYKKVFNLKNIDEFNKNRLKTYLFDNNMTQHKLLITDLISKEWDDSQLSFIKDVIHWFSHININMPDFPIHDMKYLEKVDELNKVEDILRELNTGVSKIDFTKISEDEFASRTNPHFAKAIIKDVKERYSEIVKSGKKNIREFTLRGDSYYRFLFKPQEENIDILELSLKHENCDTKFDFGDESDGTQRLFDLLDIVFTSQPNSVYVVDELERSLHPVLTYKLIEILKEELQKKNIQLIFTTHETHIMDLKLFRKDEIWFMERDNKGLSRLYSLDIFKIRNEKIIKDGYINGLYGGIPLFKKLEE